MPVLRLNAFAGETPRADAEKLPETFARTAFNVRLTRGTLDPMRGFLRVRPIQTVDPQTIFLYGSQWLEWANDVDVANAPVNNGRIYYTGDGPPKVRDGNNVYLLGVPAPSAALTATLGGAGSGDIDSRIYTYTWVTGSGEESAPAPASNRIDWRPGNTVTLSGFGTTPEDRNITKQRIYRSQSSQGGTSFFFIAERDATTANFTDSVAPDAFGEPLATLGWDEPPENLRGLVAMPNGMMAGFVGRDIYFCEPFAPYAWPSAYVLTTDYDIMGLGAYGNALAVMTTGNPYIVVGTSPDTMVMERTELNLPCVSKRSIVDLGYAVAYATPDGIATIGTGGAQLITGALFTRPEWRRVNPASIVSGQLEGRYFASYQQIEDDGSVGYGALIMDASGQTPFLVRTNVRATAYYYDIPTGRLYFVFGKNIYQWEARDAQLLEMEWRSREYVFPLPLSFSAIRVDSDDALSEEDFQAEWIAQQQVIADNQAVFGQESVRGEINGGLIAEFAINDSDLRLQTPPRIKNATITVYADGEQIMATSDFNEIVRLPAEKARRWSVEVAGTTSIKEITMATSVAELSGVA